MAAVHRKLAAPICRLKQGLCFESILPVPERLSPAYEGQLAVTLYSLLFSTVTLLNIVFLLKVLSLEFIKVDGLATRLNGKASVLCASGPSHSPACSSGRKEGTGAEAGKALKRALRG